MWCGITGKCFMLYLKLYKASWAICYPFIKWINQQQDLHWVILGGNSKWLIQQISTLQLREMIFFQKIQCSKSINTLMIMTVVKSLGSKVKLLWLKFWLSLAVGLCLYTSVSSWKKNLPHWVFLKIKWLNTRKVRRSVY